MREFTSPVLFLINFVLCLLLLAVAWTPMVFVYAAMIGVPVMFGILFNIAFMPVLRGTEPARVGNY
ncbi:hypothetical protein [Emcibacter sp.]|uniref:hypothetical protein n=1 Tax=Emcibacter sp. TaxID=1979954 RepID=UPI002AA86F41|nr:hypothetical protein [Emcibacter sp.]